MSRALRWAVHDTNAKVISVSKSLDEATGGTNAPKTVGGQRIIPIHQNLLPVLAAMAGEPASSWSRPSLRATHAAPRFRAYVTFAKVERARLTADNATKEQSDFRSLRDSHATWLALANVPDKVIQRRLGHASPTTTDRCVKAAETFDGVGFPFTPLPKSLWTRLWTTKSKPPRFPRGFFVARVGFESMKTAEFAATGEWLDPNLHQRVDASARKLVDVGPSADYTESPLEEALRLAAIVGRWDVVAQLGKELEARRLAVAGNVLSLDSQRGKRAGR